MAATVLVVDDEKDLVELVKYHLEKEGLKCLEARDGETALQLAKERTPDLVVLDLMLPGMDGLEICRKLRKEPKTSSMAIIMLTAKAEEVDRIVGLEMGADDYLPKPFAVEELLARLRALARRPPETLPATLGFEDLELNTASRVAYRQGREIRLTAREYALLEYLMRNPNRVLDRARILEHVWDDNFDPVANAVDVLVGRVRRKVDPDGEHPLIFTLRGMGYMLSARRPAGAA